MATTHVTFIPLLTFPLQDDFFLEEDQLESSMEDTKDLRKTKNYTRIVHLLRLFVDSLTRLLNTWEQFLSAEKPLVATHGEDSVEALNTHMRAISGQLEHLRSFRYCFQQKLELFDGLRNNVRMFELTLLKGKEQANSLPASERILIARGSSSNCPRGRHWVAHQSNRSTFSLPC